MNIVFCGYRDWALNIIEGIKDHDSIDSHYIIKSKEEFDIQIPKLTNKIDFIILLGWSWIVSDNFTEKYNCIGIHPSDLPSYRGGSPIQHQIIEGVTKTKISLISISNKIDGGDIWLKEDFSLKGDNINAIFKNLEESAIKLLNKFFTSKGNVDKEKQDLTLGSYYKRRIPKESRIELNDFSNRSLQEMYNFIRSLTDPYPNAYIEDDEGNRLYFKEVYFEEFNLDS